MGRHRSAPSAVVAGDLIAIGRRCYARGWAYGTSGNYSAVVRRRPLRVAITASGIAKGALSPSDILEMDDACAIVGKHKGAPSSDALLHLEILRRRDVGAVLHTHSIWATVLSSAPGAAGVAIEGFEMLKGLGARTYDHREWIPIVDNVPDRMQLAAAVGTALEANPDAHAFLIRRHGLYTWGATLEQAEHHLEIIEFLLEVVGRLAVNPANNR